MEDPTEPTIRGVPASEWFSPEAMEARDRANRYFITENDRPEREVSLDEFLNYESRAGFVGKFGPRHPATGGFSYHQGTTHISGRIEYPTDPA